jgi:hypothetical protein
LWSAYTPDGDESIVQYKETMAHLNGDDDTDPCHMLSWVMPVQAFKCPSYPDGDFTGPNLRVAISEDPYSEGKSWPLDGSENSEPYPEVAITNYVALGASHMRSLFGDVEADPNQGGSRHPNGVMCPGEAHSIRDITDGTTNTFIACETREMSLASWWEGCTAAVYGIRPQGDDESTDISFVQTTVPGGTFGEPADGEAITTLNYGDDMADPKTFFSAAGPTTPIGSVPWVHGPSSHHPGLVNHLTGDGSVRSVQEGLEAKLYMWLITRAGAEPVNEFYELE